jgi:NDP-sugar pyrophosphorylase family protein
MDTVILAAGRGTRLEGVSAPFWKPLFVVNGEPLVVKVARQAVTINLGRTVVIVSPENAQPICQVLAAHSLIGVVDIVVQPLAGGPGAAFLRAAPLLHGERAMILCADNVIPDGDVQKILDAADENPDDPLVIGTRGVYDFDEASRFTLIAEDGSIREGTTPQGAEWGPDLWCAWVGPLVVPVAALTEAIHSGARQRGDELRIGPALEVVRGDVQPLTVTVDCYDIGSPDDPS